MSDTALELNIVSGSKFATIEWMENKGLFYWNPTNNIPSAFIKVKALEWLPPFPWYAADKHAQEALSKALPGRRG